MAQDGELHFGDFQRLALDDSLSRNQKIGFPDSYRVGMEVQIWHDINQKLGLDKQSGKIVMDIGPGCGDLALMIIDKCLAAQHQMVLVDSKEMLQLLPDYPGVVKMPGRFPDVKTQLNRYAGKVDFVICYSVFHYIFAELNYIEFIHAALEMLKPGGALLLGDLPNVSKKERFLSTEEGKAFLKKGETVNLAGATSHTSSNDKMDDSILISILHRFRNYNCEAYLMPQSTSLPMSNRREDILIVKR